MHANEFHARFSCPLMQVKAEELSALGITFRPPEGELKPRRKCGRTLIEIGILLVREASIEIVPRLGLQDWHLQVLFGAAERAFHIPPTCVGGWRHAVDGTDARWITWITVEDVATTSVAARPGRRQTMTAA